MASAAKTTLLLTGLTLLLVLLGNSLAGTGGMVVAFGLALAMNGSAYWFSDRVALSMAGARELKCEDAPDLHRLVERLASRARLPKPRVYLVDSPSPNAFATGRDPSHAAVAVTAGIHKVLTADELAGVLAHELAHIRNRDTLISAVIATIAGTITMPANAARRMLMAMGAGRGDGGEAGGGAAGFAGSLVMVLVGPPAATLIRLAVSRSREYSADSLGARILGDPLPLARALMRLEAGSRAAPMGVDPAAAHQFIVHPLADDALMGLFSTHPPTWDRVSRLSRMALQTLPSV